MAELAESQPLEPPRVYLVHMVVFTLLVGILVAVILPGLYAAFAANPVLNGVIIAFLVSQIAALYPAWRASRVNIVEAIKHE